MALSQKKSYTIVDYYNLPENVRAEIIDGQIYYQAAPSRIHQEILGELYTIIHNYIKSKKGSCKVYPAPFAVELGESDRLTIVEPDISIICNPDKLTDRGCIGAPDWIIEIVSPSNSSHDYVKKLNLYANTGVREYWIVNPMKYNTMYLNLKIFSTAFYVYYFEENQFETMVYTFQNKVKVNIYEDFYIDFSDFV